MHLLLCLWIMVMVYRMALARERLYALVQDKAVRAVGGNEHCGRGGGCVAQGVKTGVLYWGSIR